MAAKKPYHKEDLRGDLLEAGRKYVKANRHVELSIRTLAQQVGVSPGAPYHDFPDRRSFLLALAIEGFEEITARARKVAAGKKVQRKNSARSEPFSYVSPVRIRT